MRRLTMLVLGLVLGVTASQGEWKLQVHQDGQTEEFVVSEIDSVTFYEDGFNSPGFTILPAGTFTMGSPESESGHQNDEEQHTVTLTTPFEIFATEVTNQQYADLAQWAYDRDYCTASSSSLRDALDGSTQELLDLDEDDCEISFSGGTFSVEAGKEDHPVRFVSWHGSASYCDWLSLEAGLTRAYHHITWRCNGNEPYSAVGYRLPTEAEWEYACRAGTETPFNTGDCLDALREANYEGNFPLPGCPSGPYFGWTVPVGSYPENDFDLYDMHGNLWEWCNDRLGAYGGDETDPVGSLYSPLRVVRGGRWSLYARYCRSAHRHGLIGNDTIGLTGFRPARSIK
jgi:formylglycine-generating enzyme required for sulfatase activity